MLVPSLRVSLVSLILCGCVGATLSACGGANTYGIAPGPQDSEPSPAVTPDPTPTVQPDVDAGGGVAPVDGGVCVPEAPALPNEAQNLAKFVELALTASFAPCAGCHSGKEPSGTGFGWGANGTGDAAWMEAVLNLYGRFPGNGPTDNPLVSRFNDRHAGPANDAAGATAVGTFLTYTGTEIGGRVCPDAGPADCIALPDALPTVEESLARFTEGQLGAAFACATCHLNGGTATGTGQGWGPDGDGSDAGWHTAMRALYDASPTTDFATHPLVTFMNGHFGTTPEGSDVTMTQWLRYAYTPSGGHTCP